MAKEEVWNTFRALHKKNLQSLLLMFFAFVSGGVVMIFLGDSFFYIIPLFSQLGAIPLVLNMKKAYKMKCPRCGGNFYLPFMPRNNFRKEKCACCGLPIYSINF